MDLFLKYFIFGITLAVSIGPVNIELIKQGMTKGFLPSWLVGIGAMVADFVIIYFVYVGLGYIFISSNVQLFLGMFGSIMLIYLGIQNYKSKNEQIISSTNNNDKKSFRTGFILAIANPINFIFWTGIYGSLLSAEATKSYSPFLLIIFIFTGIAITNFSFAALSSIGKGVLKSKGLKYLSITSGIMLIVYGLWIGYTTINTHIQALSF